MSSASQISGLVSGLDTASIVSALMGVERLPQTQLSDRKTDLNSLVTALQSLNTKTQSLTTTATRVAAASSWSALTATSSDASVTATAGATASATSLSFTVDQVAQSQVSLTGSVADVSGITGGGSTMSLKVGDAVTEIDVQGISTMADLAQAITSSGAGVNASVLSASDGSYRLQLTGRTTGADQAFTLYQGDEAAVDAGTATEVSLTTARTAQDAQLTLWPGSAAQETMTSSSNTFSDLVTGLDVTVTEQTTSPVVLDVAPDTEAISKLGSDLVSQLNLVLQEISSQTASTTSTDSSGRTVVSGGVLSGNSTVRMLSENLLQAGSYDVDGESPSTIGITVASDGTLSFDEETFNAAYAQDPSKVQSILTSIAGRVEDVGSLASDKYTGTLTSQITEDNQQIRELTDRIASWESVLADRQTALEAQWANLETALQKMNSQSSWLTSIVSSLSTSSSSSSSSSS